MVAITKSLLFFGSVFGQKDVSLVQRTIETKRCPEGFQENGNACVKVVRVQPQRYCKNGRMEGNNHCVERANHMAQCPPGMIQEGTDCLVREHITPILKCPAGYRDTGKSCLMEMPAQKVLSCADGFVQNGKDCMKRDFASMLSNKSCPAGFHQFKGQCQARKSTTCTGKAPSNQVGKSSRRHLQHSHSKVKGKHYKMYREEEGYGKVTQYASNNKQPVMFRPSGKFDYVGVGDHGHLKKHRMLGHKHSAPIGKALYPLGKGALQAERPGKNPNHVISKDFEWPHSSHKKHGGHRMLGHKEHARNNYGIMVQADSKIFPSAHKEVRQRSKTRIPVLPNKAMDTIGENFRPGREIMDGKARLAHITVGEKHHRHLGHKDHSTRGMTTGVNWTEKGSPGLLVPPSKDATPTHECTKVVYSPLEVVKFCPGGYTKFGAKCVAETRTPMRLACPTSGCSKILTAEKERLCPAGYMIDGGMECILEKRVPTFNVCPGGYEEAKGQGCVKSYPVVTGCPDGYEMVLGGHCERYEQADYIVESFKQCRGKGCE